MSSMMSISSQGILHSLVTICLSTSESVCNCTLVMPLLMQNFIAFHIALASASILVVVLMFCASAYIKFPIASLRQKPYVLHNRSSLLAPSVLQVIHPSCLSFQATGRTCSLGLYLVKNSTIPLHRLGNVLIHEKLLLKNWANV